MRGLPVFLFFIITMLSSCATPQLAQICNPQRDDTGRIARSRAAVNDFKYLNPCPSTGKPTGPCPGYVVDHIEPLCNCGPDAPANMQWQTLSDSKVKDRNERKACANRWRADID